jgi:hypothetical protein
MSLAGSLGTPHVSYIISINKDKVPPVRIYMSLKQNYGKRTKKGNVKRFEKKNKVSDKRIQKKKSRILHTKAYKHHSIGSSELSTPIGFK